MLRDEFLNNSEQTPFFNIQGTQRETFVDDARQLDDLRPKGAPSPASNDPNLMLEVERVRMPTVVEILESADARLVSKELALAFIANLFRKITERASTGLFQETYETHLIEHADYKERTARAFIIRVLAKEIRLDNLVTARITKEHRKRDPFQLQHFALNLFGNEEDIVERYELTLNCKLDKVQLKVELTPRYRSLKRFNLVVSCAPSLECCYVMEIVTEHKLRDWNVFEDEGAEVTRRWFKVDWVDQADWLVEKIFEKLKPAVDTGVTTALASLNKAAESSN